MKTLDKPFLSKLPKAKIIRDDEKYSFLDEIVMFSKKRHVQKKP